MKTKIVITLPATVSYSTAKGLLARVEKDYGAGNTMHEPGCEIEMVNVPDERDQQDYTPSSGPARSFWDK